MPGQPVLPSTRPWRHGLTDKLQSLLLLAVIDNIGSPFHRREWLPETAYDAFVAPALAKSRHFVCQQRAGEDSPPLPSYLTAAEGEQFCT